MSLYSVLGIEQTASSSQIKQAFRSLALVHHPDKSQGGNEDFHQIRHAYEVLSDQRTKALYDHELERAQKRKEQGLPPETDRPSFSATSNDNGKVTASWEDAYPFGLIVAMLLISQHVLLCIFRLRTVLALNLVTLIGTVVTGLLLPSDLLALCGLLGTIGGLLGYWLIRIFATKLCGFAMTVPLIACVTWEAATLFAWRLGLPRDTALFSALALAATQLVIHLVWWEEYPLLAFAVAVTIRLEYGDRAGDLLMFYAVLKTLNNLLAIYQWTIWLLSSAFRVFVYGAAFWASCRVFAWAYVKAGRPAWAQKAVHTLDDVAFAICMRVLPASVMKEAYKVNEERRTARPADTEAPEAEPAAAKKKKKRRKRSE